MIEKLLYKATKAVGNNGPNVYPDKVYAATLDTNTKLITIKGHRQELTYFIDDPLLARYFELTNVQEITINLII